MIKNNYMTSIKIGDIHKSITQPIAPLPEKTNLNAVASSGLESITALFTQAEILTSNINGKKTL